MARDTELYCHSVDLTRQQECSNERKSQHNQRRNPNHSLKPLRRQENRPSRDEQWLYHHG